MSHYTVQVVVMHFFHKNVNVRLAHRILEKISSVMSFLFMFGTTVTFSHLPFSLQQVAVGSGVSGMVRPVTGADVGIRRAEIHPGLREVILCKDQDGKVGLRLREIDNVSKSYIY